MKIVIIDPAKHRVETDVFNKIANYSPIKCEYHVPQYSDSYRHINHDEVSAMIILGSDFDVEDQPVWQKTLTQEIIRCQQKNIPLLGICYGHQLVAHVFGCQLGPYTNDKQKFVGTRKINLSSNKIWKEKTFDLQYTHRQAVTSLSSEMKIIGHSSSHQFEVLKHKDCETYTFQGHPEQKIATRTTPLAKDNYWIIQRFIDYACSIQPHNHF